MARSKYERWKEQCGLESVRRMAEDGLAEEEMAVRIGIGLSLFRRWKKRYPDFNAAIELGRTGSDFAVVEALYKKAIGYNVAINKTYKLKRIDYDPDTGKKLREYEELATGVDESYIPGDLRAETFWLKNRQPERWGERPDREIGEESEGGIVELPVADSIDDE